NNVHKDENILVAPKDRVLNNFPGMMETIQDNGGPAVGITGSPWNGFCATADMYNKYESSDKRIRQWLVGPQREADGTRTIDDDYNPGADIAAGGGTLSYNLSVISFDKGLYPNEDSFNFAGARNVKYYPEQNGNCDGTNMGNDLVMMRYADVLLMKVEAELRLNGTVASIDLLNQVRERAYGDALHNIANPTLDDIYDERTREFMWEGYSRRDGIRFEVAAGKPYFSAARAPEKSADNTDGHTRIFPIPAIQIASNANLIQNPGY
ncbi:MAG: RagB/SusD family nutrient uptake outer membrane protein, partial [Panacibacter sp.]